MFKRLFGKSASIVGRHSVVVGGFDTVTGEGSPVTEGRDFPAFTGFELAAPARINYQVVTDRQRVKITAPTNIHGILTTRVKDRRLIIELSANIRNSDIQIDIEAASPDYIGVSGAGEAIVVGVDSSELTTKISGAGDLDISGKVTASHLEINGAGNCDMSALAAEDLDIDCSGAASVTAKATQSVKIDVSGAAQVEILGNPIRRRTQTSGAAAIRFC